MLNQEILATNTKQVVKQQQQKILDKLQLENSTGSSELLKGERR